MRSNDLLKRLFLPLFALVITFSLAGCSGCGGGQSDTAGSAGDDAGQVDDANASGSAGAHDGHDHGDGAGQDHDGTGGGDGTGAAATVDPWSRTYDTPEAERAGTIQNLQGLRATLVAELESVRARLKDGTRSAEDRKADQQRASELAQGLERLDRTIKGIGEANDATWAQVRDSELKAAAEFREWMKKYGMPS